MTLTDNRERRVPLAELASLTERALRYLQTLGLLDRQHLVDVEALGEVGSFVVEG